jgi:3alpha(or 20beta)-hydroxysteroid dehydrogenase
LGRLDGKVALITGGAGGQGTEEARRFSGEGAAGIVLADVADDAGHRAAAEIANASYVHLDVTAEADWDAATGGSTSSSTMPASTSNGRSST